MATTKMANGNIAPSRFVKQDTTAEGKVLQCGNTEKMFGISHEGKRNPPLTGLDDGYAAIAGEGLPVYCWHDTDECWLELGGTVAVDDRLGSDASGMGVTTTSDNAWVGAVALQGGVSGQLIKVKPVSPGQRY